MNTYLASVRPLDELTEQQRLFLGGVAARIPKLFEAMEVGGSSARFKLGTRRLDDGRHVELELVAPVPERKWDASPQPGDKCGHGHRPGKKRKRSVLGD